jgi:CheY-like chemotaxis protein
LAKSSAAAFIAGGGVFGFYVVQSVNDEHTFLARDGVGQVVDITVKMQKSAAPAPIDLFASHCSPERGRKNDYVEPKRRLKRIRPNEGMGIMDGGSILVVEDEPLILMDIEAALEEAGFAVTGMTSSESALTAFGAEPDTFKALVTDIRLGSGKSGWELAREIRAKKPALPIIYISGDSAEHWPSEGVPNSLMISKPFFMPQITTALASLLNDQQPGDNA